MLKKALDGLSKTFFFGSSFPLNMMGPWLSVALRLENYIIEEKERKKTEVRKKMSGFLFFVLFVALRLEVYINGMEKHLSESRRSR